MTGTTPDTIAIITTLFNLALADFTMFLQEIIKLIESRYAFLETETIVQIVQQNTWTKNTVGKFHVAASNGHFEQIGNSIAKNNMVKKSLLVRL